MRLTPDQQPATKRDPAELETRTVDTLIKTMREMQREILRALQHLARSGDAHFRRLETAQATTERLAALEERVIALVTRPTPRRTARSSPMHPAATSACHLPEHTR